MRTSLGPRCDMTSHIRRTSPGFTLASLPNSRIPAIPHIQLLHPMVCPLQPPELTAHDPNSQDRLPVHARVCQMRRFVTLPCDPTTRIFQLSVPARLGFCHPILRSSLEPLRVAITVRVR